jgi:hypothetical protein
MNATRSGVAILSRLSAKLRTHRLGILPLGLFSACFASEVEESYYKQYIGIFEI